MDEQEAVEAFSGEVWYWFGNMVALSATTVGIELGLFDAIHERGPQTPGELAQYLELRPRPVETWAKVLLSRGVLELRGEGRVTMAEGVAPIVSDRDTLAYMGHAIRYHGRFLANDFLDLTTFFQDGRPRPPARHGMALVRNVAAQTQTMQTLVAAAVLPAQPTIEQKLRDSGHVLDVGCGIGAFGELLCRIYPTITYTGIDIDTAAIAEGQEVAAGSPVGDRIDLIAADLTTLDRRDEFDVAVLLLTLHEVALDLRAPLMRAVNAALRPGSTILVVEEIYPATLEEADEGIGDMGLHFEYSEMLWGSRVPTRDELHELLVGAGFASVTLEEIVDGGLTIATGVAT